jgi:hypothetical protein
VVRAGARNHWPRPRPCCLPAVRSSHSGSGGRKCPLATTLLTGRLARRGSTSSRRKLPSTGQHAWQATSHSYGVCSNACCHITRSLAATRKVTTAPATTLATDLYPDARGSHPGRHFSDHLTEGSGRERDAKLTACSECTYLGYWIDQRAKETSPLRSQAKITPRVQQSLRVPYHPTVPRNPSWRNAGPMTRRIIWSYASTSLDGTPSHACSPDTGRSSHTPQTARVRPDEPGR